jgi:molybdopterin/thiamine biosynthesis adenylyltransferase
VGVRPLDVFLRCLDVLKYKGVQDAMKEGIPLDELRYSRQTLFSGIGPDGQRRLSVARVAIVGLGALGTVLANHMVRAGVGFVRLIDRDFVEASNLQRQMLYDEEDARQSQAKAHAAARTLRRINSAIEIESHVVDLNPLNAEQLLSDVDLILDGSDNFAVRFLLNDVAVKHRIPWIYGGAVRSRGTMMPILPEHTPCLRCIFANVPDAGSVETCDTAGIIAPIIDIVASYQAACALKWFVGSRTQMPARMLQFDPWELHYSAIDVSGQRKPDCPACAARRFDFLSLQSEQAGDTVQTLCGRDAVQVQPRLPQTFDLHVWAERWQPLGEVVRNPFLLKLKVDEQHTLVLFGDGRLLVQGTDDPVVAKNFYSRYIGN